MSSGRPNSGCSDAVRAAIGAGLLMLLAATTWANYLDAYRRGRKACEQGDWVDARRFMEQAIADQPQESADAIKIYGTRYEIYLPHFYLGLASFHLDDCERALREWETSESQGVANREGKLAEVEGMRRTCEDAVRPPPSAAPQVTPTPAGPDPRALAEALRRAESALAQAAAAETAVGGLAADPSYDAVWSASGGEMAARREAAGHALRQARENLEAGRASLDPDRLEQAATLAGQAATLLLQVTLDAVRIRDRLRPTVQPTSLPQANTPTLARPLARRPPEPAQPPPSQRLQTATELLKAGEYTATLTLLERDESAGRHEAATRHLLRAAACYALYRAGGRQDAALLSRTEAAVRACKSRDPALAPDPAIFSPSFVEFYGGVK